MTIDGTCARVGGASTPKDGPSRASTTFTFPTSITFAVMVFVGALAALLILIQFKTFRRLYRTDLQAVVMMREFGRPERRSQLAEAKMTIGTARLSRRLRRTRAIRSAVPVVARTRLAFAICS